MAAVSPAHAAPPAFVETNETKAIASLGDFTKWFTGLSTAGLAFSIGLHVTIGDYGGTTRALLMWTWFFYAASVISGVITQSAFPKLVQKGWTIDNPYVKWAYRTSFGTLILGSLLAFATLLSVVRAQPPPEALAVRTAQDAVARLSASYKPPYSIVAVTKIELLTGSDTATVREKVWYLEATVHQAPSKAAAARQFSADAFIDADTGVAKVVQPE
jgi:hypothetical protein